MRNDWAKGRADRVMPLAKLLHEEDIQKGVTIAIQSMNRETLKAVKRKNLDNGKFSQFFQMYDLESVPAFVEMIMGLPRETVESFIQGATDIMELGMHTYVTYNPLVVLPNTPFFEKSYQEKYNIVLKEVYQPFAHFEVNNIDEYKEKSYLAISHDTMTEEQYVEAFMYRWLFSFGHYFAYTQYIARFLRSAKNISYKEFYLDLYEWIKDNPDTILGKEYDETYSGIKNVLNQDSLWGRVISQAKKNFYWEFEEASAIVAMLNVDIFYEELSLYLQKYNLEAEVLDSLLKYQSLRIQRPDEETLTSVQLDYNIHHVVQLREKEISKGAYRLDIEGDKFDSVYDWAKKCFWWGKRAALFKTRVVE